MWNFNQEQIMFNKLLTKEKYSLSELLTHKK